MDAEEIARLVADLRVTTNLDDKAVTITVDEMEKRQKRIERVVVGKIFSRRATNRDTLRSNLPRIFRSRGSTEIEMVGHNIFVISFALESDKRIALEEGPWHFFQDLMVLKQSQPMQTPMDVKFDELTLWVQCHNVPLECMEPSIIERIGGQVGLVEEVDVGEGGLCVGKFARVRVKRRIDEPLLLCVPLKHENMDKEVIVLLQYEKLPDFCFLCGRVGHISRDCTDATVDKNRPRFDCWLRAGRSFVGRRSVEVGNRNENLGRSPGPRAVGLGRGDARREVRELGRGEERVVESGMEKEVRAVQLVGDDWGEKDPVSLAIVGVDRAEGSSEENHDVCMG